MRAHRCSICRSGLQVAKARDQSMWLLMCPICDVAGENRRLPDGRKR